MDSGVYGEEGQFDPSENLKTLANIANEVHALPEEDVNMETQDLNNSRKRQAAESNTLPDKRSASEAFNTVVCSRSPQDSKNEDVSHPMEFLDKTGALPGREKFLSEQDPSSFSGGTNRSLNKRLLDAAQPFLVPVQVGSVLLAGWGTNMAARVLSEALGGVRATHKFLALELTVLLPEVQSLLAHRVAGLFPCSVPFTPIFWGNQVVNVLTLLEVLALSLWAHRLYCVQEPGFHRMPEDEEGQCPQEMVDVSRTSGLR